MDKTPKFVHISSYFKENDSLKHEFSLCLLKPLAPVHPIEHSFLYEASIERILS